MMPWSDLSGTFAVAAISILLALNFHKEGRHGFKTGFYISLGNLIISAGAVVGNFGTFIGGWLAVPYYLVLSSVCYFAAIGALETFKLPKNVKCFRCGYIGYPNQTESEKTPYSERELQAFRSLDSEIRQSR